MSARPTAPVPRQAVELQRNIKKAKEKLKKKRPGAITEEVWEAQQAEVRAQLTLWEKELCDMDVTPPQVEAAHSEALDSLIPNAPTPAAAPSTAAAPPVASHCREPPTPPAPIASATSPTSQRRGMDQSFAHESSCIDRSVHRPSPRDRAPRVDIVHPAIAELACLFQRLQIVGCNARTVALLHALRQAVAATPLLDVAVLRGPPVVALLEYLQVNLNYVAHARNSFSGLEHIQRVLRHRLVTLDGAVNSKDDRRMSFGSVRKPPAAMRADDDETPRNFVLRVIAEMEEELFNMTHTIVTKYGPLHRRGDVVLTYGRSSVIEMLLTREVVEGHHHQSVIVLDSGPLSEGRAMAWRLRALGVDVVYALITSVCALMPRCTKVILGASAVLQNGDIVGRSGTAAVAAVGQRFQKPVIVFCESYKFLPKVWLAQTAEQAAATAYRRDLQDARGETVELNAPPPAVERHISRTGYLYDVTPSALVDMVVCELGPLHTSAIVSALRDREERERRGEY